MPDASVVNLKGEFEAIKSLSGWEAARSDEHQFHAKIKASKLTLAVFKLLSFEKWSEQRKKERKKGEKWHFRYCTL